jgi:hypothetical protein
MYIYISLYDISFTYHIIHFSVHKLSTVDVHWIFPDFVILVSTKFLGGSSLYQARVKVWKSEKNPTTPTPQIPFWWPILVACKPQKRSKSWKEYEQYLQEIKKNIRTSKGWSKSWRNHFPLSKIHMSKELGLSPLPGRWTFRCPSFQPGPPAEYLVN